MFKKGDRVIIDGLSNAKYNGLCGTLVEKIEAKERWQVALENDDKTKLSIRLENLILDPPIIKVCDFDTDGINKIRGEAEHARQTSSTGYPASWKQKGSVFIHPEDTKQYPPMIFSDPATFLPSDFPTPSNSDSRATKWGIWEPDEFSNDRAAFMMAMMRGHNPREKILYAGFGPRTSRGDNPLMQFIKLLEKRKRAEVNTEVVQNALTKVFTIRISLVRCPQVWRRFRVPGRTALSVLHDQILVAVMGWGRGYHGYVFEGGDGCAIGPINDTMAYVDMMHAENKYKYVMHDKKLPLALLLQKVGDVCYYTYDLGDHFEHMLVVEEVEEADQAQNADHNVVQILDGRCACPPEDSNGLPESGCEGYEQLLNLFRKNPHACAKAIHEGSQSVNYCGSPVGELRPSSFQNPLVYDLEHHQKLLRLLLGGPRVSKKGGFKAFQAMQAQDGSGFKEQFKQCALCGDRLSPLKACAKCTQVYYCGRTCQTKDWSVHKVSCAAKMED